MTLCCKSRQTPIEDDATEDKTDGNKLVTIREDSHDGESSFDSDEKVEMKLEEMRERFDAMKNVKGK